MCGVGVEIDTTAKAHGGRCCGTFGDALPCGTNLSERASIVASATMAGVGDDSLCFSVYRWNDSLCFSVYRGEQHRSV